MCDVIPLLVDFHIVGMGKPIFGRNRDPTVVLASGHFYNWLEVAANWGEPERAPHRRGSQEKSIVCL